MTALHPPSPPRRWLQGLLFLAAGVLAGCGGGGEGGVGTGGTGTYALGTITGFGSIIVNGVRFDDSAASVLDDDDATRSRDELKLGMTRGHRQRRHPQRCHRPQRHRQPHPRAQRAGRSGQRAWTRPPARWRCWARRCASAR